MKRGGSLAAALWLAGALPAAGLVVSLDVKDPPTLDPHKQFAHNNHTLCQQIFEGLVRFDREGRVVPVLAVSWERLDALRVRFRLREGVRFHNGEAFDAGTVKFSLERYLDPAVGFPARAFLDSIASVEIRDASTVDIVTKYPDGLLLNRLAGFVLMVPKEHLRKVAQEEFARRPVGTGPFRFDSWAPGKSILLKANKNYWLEGLPKAESLEFRFLSMEERVAALKRGELDLIWEVPGTMTTEIHAASGTEIRKGDTFYTVYVGINYSTGPLADIRVRRALDMAIDRPSLIRYDLFGNGRQLASATMPQEGGHNPKLALREYDPEGAVRLLTLAGYGKGLALKAVANVNATRPAKILAAQLKRVGVALEVEYVAEADFHRFREGAFDLSIAGLPDPMAHSYFIHSLIFHSQSPFALAAGPEVDAKLGEMVATIDDAQRERKARELDAYVYENVLGLATYQRIQTYGVREGVEFEHFVTGMPYFHQARKGERYARKDEEK